MPFCPKCGTKLRETASFCSSCGAPTYHGAADLGGIISDALKTAGKEMEDAFRTARIEIEKAIGDARSGVSDRAGSFCPRCGKRNPVGASFCFSCGRSIPSLV
ncbi:MAG TPA: zinc ribbon domain-containing protein [Candidatus Acidoferrum sp.]|nr:zinc ribbon domain-containing protein [Candidatus Acidoferrum sp.]